MFEDIPRFVYFRINERAWCTLSSLLKEYEVVASTAAAEDCGTGGGVAVKHGTVGKGPVVGLVQVQQLVHEESTMVAEIGL